MKLKWHQRLQLTRLAHRICECEGTLVLADPVNRCGDPHLRSILRWQYLIVSSEVFAWDINGLTRSVCSPISKSSSSIPATGWVASAWGRIIYVMKTICGGPVNYNNLEEELVRLCPVVKYPRNRLKIESVKVVRWDLRTILPRRGWQQT